MAIALVDVQMYTLAEMKEKEEMLKGRIEVREGSKVSLEALELYARRPATRASPHFGRGLVVTNPLKMFYMGILDSSHHLLV